MCGKENVKRIKINILIKIMKKCIYEVITEQLKTRDLGARKQLMEVKNIAVEIKIPKNGWKNKLRISPKKQNKIQRERRIF